MKNTALSRQLLSGCFHNQACLKVLLGWVGLGWLGLAWVGLDWVGLVFSLNFLLMYPSLIFLVRVTLAIFFEDFLQIVNFFNGFSDQTRAYLSLPQC